MIYWGIALGVVLCLALYIRYKITHKTLCVSFRQSMDLCEMPVITFNHNGNKYNFLLDTGSSACFINQSVLKTMKAELMESTRAATIGFDGTLMPNKTYKIVFSYQNVEFTTSFLSVDLNATFASVKQRKGVTIHGILGTDWLKDNKWILDFKELAAYMKK